MATLPSLSIIIPVYQVEAFILACLESVVAQAYEGRVEVILVDDYGSDNSVELVKTFVEKYQGSFSFLLYCHTHNKGLSAARNTGMHHATGDYLLFLDGDDELLPNALINLAAPALSESYDVILGRALRSDDVTSRTLPEYSKLYGDAILDEYIKGHLSLVAWNKLYRREMIVSNSLFFREGIIREDDLWNFHVSRVAQSYFIIKERTYLYRIRSGSIMANLDKEKEIRSLHVIISELIDFAKKNSRIYDRDLCRMIESYRCSILLNSYPDKNRFIAEYLKLRESNPVKWIDYFRMEFFHPIKELRLLHYAFPAKFGAEYQFWWLRRKIW